MTTTYTYQESRITSRTVDGKTWSYAYDGDKLASVAYPTNGAYEVFCYRAGAVGNCDPNAAPTKHLQWRAMAASPIGAGWSEAIRYGYGPSGALLKEEYLVPGGADGEVRRSVRHEADPHGNPTFEITGSGMNATRRLFDGAGNLTGLSMPFQGASHLCGATAPGAPVDPRCAALSYDTADRLIALDEAGAQGDTSRTSRSAFTYDSQGNLSGAKQGCAITSTFGNCPQKQARYQYDDFGNLIEFSLPDSSGVHADGSENIDDPGPTHVEYDAMGNQVRKQTVGMTRYWASSPPNHNRYLQWTYDSLGRRVLFQSFLPGSGLVTLSTNVWDTEGWIPGVNCNNYFQASLTTRAGRLASTTDPLYKTWYGYDAEGRVTRELRIRLSATDCTNYTDQWPTTSYDYNINGDLAHIYYPQGRTAEYIYGIGGLGRRILYVNVSQYLGGWSNSPAVQGIAWEPYGGLRRYTVYDPINWSPSATVEYHYGSASELATGVTSCNPGTSDTPTGVDQTGRLRAIFVTKSDGTSLMKRFYSWNQDQISRMDTCFLPSGGAPQTEVFAYDSRGRLTTATMGNSATSGGAYASRTYTYDDRGNRTSVGLGDGNTLSTVWSSYPATPDHLWQQYATGPGIPPWWSTGVFSMYDYTQDGQVSRLSGPYDSSGARSEVWTFDWGESVNTPAGFGQESVFRAVSGTGGPNYPSYMNYAYDAQRRRIQKRYPLGGTDEFFWDQSRHLLTDRGLQSPLMDTSTYWPIDEYVWLGDRPVMQIRGGMTRPWPYSGGGYGRTYDGSGTCMRNGESTPCASYYIVTDHVQRPIVMLNPSMQITGTGEYDPFGHVNRVQHFVETAHPYANTTASSAVYPDIGQPAQPGMNVQVAAHFSLLDTEDACGKSDYVRFEGPGGGALDANTYAGYHKGDTWTNWVTQPASGMSRLSFVSDTGSSMAVMPGYCSGSHDYYGFTLKEFQYRRYQASTPFFTPLRAAGQYWDQETDLFENWNRYYDPGSGRYLSTEPLLQSPRFTLIRSMAGMTVPTYANNNPIRFRDPTGKCSTTYDCCVEEEVAGGRDPTIRCGDGPGPGNIRNPQHTMCAEEQIRCDARCAAASQGRCPTGPSGSPLPPGIIEQTRKSMCESICAIAFAVCMAKAPL